MGTPGAKGMQPTSAAQTGSKTFPAGTDPASITHMSGLPDATATMIGSPVQPEIRQVTPVAEMGDGYREAGPGDPC